MILGYTSVLVARHCILPAPKEYVWALVKTSALLENVSSPLVRFAGIDSSKLPDVWREHATVQLRSYLFGVIPLGIRTLYFESVDDDTMFIQTRESDPLIQTWDHTIRLEDAGNGQTRYSDEIILRAGVLTIPVWLFACLFFKHRQRRWQKIARNARP